MFLNPMWSLLLLCVPVALYWFVIRPRLRIAFTDTYAHIDDFWERIGARVWAFRSFLTATLGAILAALPDLLVQVSSLDFSSLPQPWPMWVSLGVSVTLTLFRAFDTKPGNT